MNHIRPQTHPQQQTSKWVFFNYKVLRRPISSIGHIDIVVYVYKVQKNVLHNENPWMIFKYLYYIWRTSNTYYNTAHFCIFALWARSDMQYTSVSKLEIDLEMPIRINQKENHNWCQYKDKEGDKVQIWKIKLKNIWIHFYLSFQESYQCYSS